MRHVAVEEPIERGVALHTGFGYNDEIGGVFFALLDRPNDGGGVAFVVPVGTVFLPDGDAHKFVFDLSFRSRNLQTFARRFAQAPKEPNVYSQSYNQRLELQRIEISQSQSPNVPLLRSLRRFLTYDL